MGWLKASGHVGNHPAIAKLLAEIPVKQFTQLSNASLDEGRFLADWPTSIIISVHKVEYKGGCGSYRPMSLPSVVLKNFEKVSLDNRPKAKSLMLVGQHGFRRKLSCLTNLISVPEEVIYRTDRGK